jgi:hypothetical protein
VYDPGIRGFGNFLPYTCIDLPVIGLPDAGGARTFAAEMNDMPPWHVQHPTSHLPFATF